jgi:hypothetical protein
LAAAIVGHLWAPHTQKRRCSDGRTSKATDIRTIGLRALARLVWKNVV